MNSYCAERGSRGVPIGPQKAMGHELFSFGEELAASPSRRRAQTWRSLFIAPCALDVLQGYACVALTCEKPRRTSVSATW